MSILSGPEIIRQVREGNIRIEPFDEARIGPNSYDVALSPTLLVMDDVVFDICKPALAVRKIEIPPEGQVISIGYGYLGSTVERITCNGFVPWLDGRSTLGRYFLQLHQTAGRGDDGFDGHFTCEITATFRAVRIYAGIPIGQVSFFRLEGERRPYAGRYQGQTGPRLPTPFKRGKA